MKDLKEMTAKEAIRAAKEKSGRTSEELSKRANVSVSVIKRYLNENDPYTPSLEMLPRLCEAFGNTLMLDWASAQLEGKNPQEKEGMLSSVAKAISVLENLRFLIGRSNSMTSLEERGINDALDEAELECDRIRAALPHGRSCVCGGKKGFWCPLWKLRKLPKKYFS